MANREHKFRAWDVENNEMIDGDSLAFEEYQPLAYLLQDSEYMKFMEYTGLKDSNGKYIYEGDIVKDEKGNLAYIEFLQQEMGYVIIYKDHDERLGHRNSGGEYAYDAGLEIVGNIYQNPDLLK